MWHTSLRRPVPQHQADGHQRDGHREIPTHAVSEELFHPWIRGALCAAASGRGGHTAAAGCCPARGSAAAPVTLVLGNK